MIIKKKFRLLLALIALFICLSSIEKTYAKYITSASGNTDVTISFTGNAGPLCLDDKPVGTIFVGICYKNEVQTFKYELGNRSRNEIREAIVLESISLLKKFLKEKD